MAEASKHNATVAEARRSRIIGWSPRSSSTASHAVRCVACRRVLPSGARCAGGRLSAPEVSLLDPFIFGPAEIVGLIRRQRENCLVLVFGDVRGPEHLGRWHG